MSTVEVGPASELSGKREATKAANRTAILDAARIVFADQGYGAASVRDIVRRTGLATGTFYNYFPDKEAVLRAVLLDTASEVQSRLREARAQAADLEDFLATGLRVYFSFLVEDRATFELVRRNAGTIRALFGEPVLVGGLEDLRADLREGVARGALPDMDVEYASAAMFGAGFEVGMLMLERDPPDVEGATAFVAGLFVGGLPAAR